MYHYRKDHSQKNNVIGLKTILPHDSQRKSRLCTICLHVTEHEILNGKKCFWYFFQIEY